MTKYTLAALLFLTLQSPSSADVVALRPGPPRAARAAEAVIADTVSAVVRIERADGGPRGSGSGFVFDAEGHVITNAHVIGRASTFTVRFADGRSEAATLVGKDPRIDIAVLRIAPFPGMTPLSFAPSSPATGASVYAIGSPLNLPISVSRGIVSGIGRAYDVAWPVEFLQHDAAINPGNSGGPLIDSQGRVVGINTASPPEAMYDIGIGLAIPAEVALRTARLLIRDGRIERGALGLMVSAADTQVATAIGAPNNPGLLIDSVVLDSAAARAGIAAGDLLVALDGAPMIEPRDLSFKLLESRPGQIAVVQVVRSGAPLEFRVALQRDDPNGGERARAGQLVPSVVNVNPDLGLAFADDTSLASGVSIKGVADQSPADHEGIRSGDRLLAVNGIVVRDAKAATERVALARSSVVVLRIERPGLGIRHFAIPRRPDISVQRSASETRSVGPV